MAGRIIGIISIKGGVGKTSSVANLGYAISQFGKSVLVIDANFTAPNLSLHFGLLEHNTTLHDVLLNRATADEAIYQHEHGIHILPGDYISSKVNPFRLKEKIKHLRDYYDIILIDSSPNLNEEILATMIASDELLVVTCPDYSTLSTTMRAVKVAREKGLKITGLILNRVRNKKFELSLHDIEKAVNVPVLCVLPETIRMPKSIASTKPVTLFNPRASVSVEYKKLAASLIGQKYKDPRFFHKLKSFFKRDLDKDFVNRFILESKR